ncbi:MAG: hypothetical protein A2Z24_02280 [Candidatus Woykebacteria bacterium RBG_16_44_10]|uniref:Uncharacterized protein n=1 Tax=Candidatus Woykebacteria bacterium RBG_16_44_10 TaxID=1802597 RepID=A0A1G1WG03_9BACT|nr:MAG: hypothetical protein A2Z24_02280 [Candidatus Woykebacteria bacterium RBG_16_44_10]
MVRTLIDEGILQSGLILCGGARLRHGGEFRRRAREVADQDFPVEAKELTGYFGTIYRYENHRSKTVVGFLTRKEKLFGEWGEPTHVALVQFFREGKRTFIAFHDLTARDLIFLREVLRKSGLTTIAEYQNTDQPMVS